MRCTLTDSFGLSIRDRVLMFEVYAFQILRLLTECLTHYLAIFFTDIDRSGPLTVLEVSSHLSNGEHGSLLT